MADIKAKQVKNIRIESITKRYEYSEEQIHTVNGEVFTNEELYELYKDIEDILPYKYEEHKKEE